jgi:O-antigen/teichoic acid export membrane protein
MTEFRQLPVLQRLFRAAATAILLISMLYCGWLAYTFIAGEAGADITGTDRLVMIVSAGLATVSLVVMSADTHDYLMRAERRFKLKDVRKLEIIVLIALGLALSMSALVVGPQMFAALVPAVAIYTLLVVRPTNAEAHAEAQETIKRLRSESKERRATKRKTAPRNAKGKSKPRSRRKR